MDEMMDYIINQNKNIENKYINTGSQIPAF